MKIKIFPPFKGNHVVFMLSIGIVDCFALVHFKAEMPFWGSEQTWQVLIGTFCTLGPLHSYLQHPTSRRNSNIRQLIFAWSILTSIIIDVSFQLIPFHCMLMYERNPHFRKIKRPKVMLANQNSTRFCFWKSDSKGWKTSQFEGIWLVKKIRSFVASVIRIAPRLPCFHAKLHRDH